MKIKLLLFLTVLGGMAIVYNFDEHHITKSVIRKPYDIVWSQLSNPLNYPSLYPNWVKSVKIINENRFWIDDQFGSGYEIKITLNKEFSVIDIEIGTELSQLRILKGVDGSTIVLHLAQKWEKIGFIGWFFHKFTTDKDFKNAKQIIEALM